MDTTLRPIGVVRSVLKSRKDCPKQGSEGAPDAWIELDARYAEALEGLKAGDNVVLLTWFHQTNRETLRVHPRGMKENPEMGVFATRSPDRPNPIGLHEVKVLAIDGTRVHVEPLEALNGTPLLYIKPMLC